jgi:Tol biopolymer transport system component
MRRVTRLSHLGFMTACLAVNGVVESASGSWKNGGRRNALTACPSGVGELAYNSTEPDSLGRLSADVFLICTDGSGKRRLTASPGYDGAPQWSPDGRRIAFISDRHSGGRPGAPSAANLYIMNADGSDVRRISDRYVGNFSWAPDGHRVAFVSVAGLTPEDSADANRWAAKRDIFLINDDGTGLVNLTNSPGAENFPAWSPDGKEIAFAWRGRLGDRTLAAPPRTPAEDWADIYVMNADGGDVRRLTVNTVGVSGCCEDTAPRWSPDSRWIAFISKRDGNSELYKMHRDGSEQTRLTQDSTFDGYPAWSGDGALLAFNKHVAAVRGGAARTADSLYIIRADGTGRRALGLPGSRPEWRWK